MSVSEEYPSSLHYLIFRLQPGALSVDVVVTTDSPALFVSLTTLAQGRFSKNAFIIPSKGSVTVSFLVSERANSLRQA